MYIYIQVNLKKSVLPIFKLYFQYTIHSTNIIVFNLLLLQRTFSRRTIYASGFATSLQGGKDARTFS